MDEGARQALAWEKTVKAATAKEKARCELIVRHVLQGNTTKCGCFHCRDTKTLLECALESIRNDVEYDCGCYICRERDTKEGG